MRLSRPGNGLPGVPGSNRDRGKLVRLRPEALRHRSRRSSKSGVGREGVPGLDLTKAVQHQPCERMAPPDGRSAVARSQSPSILLRWSGKARRSSCLAGLSLSAPHDDHLEVLAQDDPRGIAGAIEPPQARGARWRAPAAVVGLAGALLVSPTPTDASRRRVGYAGHHLG